MRMITYEEKSKLYLGVTKELRNLRQLRWRYIGEPEAEELRKAMDILEELQKNLAQWLDDNKKDSGDYTL